MFWQRCKEFGVACTAFPMLDVDLALIVLAL